MTPSYEIDPDILAKHRARFADRDLDRFNRSGEVRTIALDPDNPIIVDDAPQPYEYVVRARSAGIGLVDHQPKRRRVTPSAAPNPVKGALPITAETVQALRANGLTYKQIAAELRCSEFVVYERIRRKTPKTPEQGRTSTGAVIGMTDAVLIEMRGRGLKLRQIAKHFGCTICAVSKRLQRAR